VSDTYTFTLASPLRGTPELINWLFTNGVKPDNVRSFTVEADELVTEEYARDANGRYVLTKDGRDTLRVTARYPLRVPVPDAWL
jgi:hypothetical protein